MIHDSLQMLAWISARQFTWSMSDCQAISAIASKRHLRSADTGTLFVPRTTTTLGMRSFAVAGHTSGTVCQLPFEPQRSRLWRSLDISSPTCLTEDYLGRALQFYASSSSSSRGGREGLVHPPFLLFPSGSATGFFDATPVGLRVKYRGSTVTNAASRGVSTEPRGPIAKTNISIHPFIHSFIRLVDRPSPNRISLIRWVVGEVRWGGALNFAGAKTDGPGDIYIVSHKTAQFLF